MEPTDRQPDSTTLDDGGDRALDALLAAARWPEPDEASTRRLVARWAAVSAARSGRRSVRALAAVAAVVLVTAGLAVVVVSRRMSDGTSRPPAVAKPQTAPSLAVQVKASPPARHEVAPVLYVPGGRAPTARERLAVTDVRRPGRVVRRQVGDATTASRTTGGGRAAGLFSGVSARSPSPGSTTPQVIGPTDDDASLLRRGDPQSLRRYLARVADARTRARSLAALDGLSDPPVDALLGELSNASMAVRYAAARALGRVGGEATTAALIGRVEDRVQPREALAALLCSRDVQRRSVLASYRGSRELAAVVRAVEVQLKHY